MSLGFRWDRTQARMIVKTGETMEFRVELLIATLKSVPEIIETYVSNIPKDKLDLKRNKETWTIREHVYHLASVQNMLYQRIELIHNTIHPIIEPFFPENQVSINKLYTSIQHSFNEYKSVRKDQMVLIGNLNKNDFTKEAKHGEYVNYNIPLIMNHMIFHEYWHMYRIEEIWLTKDEFFK